jgi:hypothetical protein
MEYGLIKDSTIQGIADGLRAKGIVTNTITPEAMAEAINDFEMPEAPPEEAFTITGNCSYKFYGDAWQWYVEKLGNKVTTDSISNLYHAFDTSKLTRIPFDLNVTLTTGATLEKTFYYASKLTECPKIRGTAQFNTSFNMDSFMNNCSSLRDVEDLFEPEFFNGFETVKVTSAFSSPRANSLFYYCSSLRRLPSWFYNIRLNKESTSQPYNSYHLYYYLGSNCKVLDEALNIPVWTCKGAATSNLFSNYFFTDCYRLKNLTFETDNGVPIEATWKAQTIDLTKYVGFPPASNSYAQPGGISSDKEVKDDASYQALKNDPDWYVYGGSTETCLNYARYNHDSAVNTINSLPDTSAYLASAGGTNTIKFKKGSGAKTDGGDVSNLTAEEIAVAAAKGWTVTLT